MQPAARILLDSRHPDPRLAYSRVTTFEVIMHRFVLAEFNTHRMFSRNSASSRAIPVSKQIERVRTNPALPLVWPAEQKGMQGGEALPDDEVAVLQRMWEATAAYVASVAEEMSSRGLHKSLCNRLLEPFMWHVVIVTATEWENFWYQRCSPLAQPEIRVVAELMREAYEASIPTVVPFGQWHLPLVTGYDETALRATYGADAPEVCKLISAARCARVSYLTHAGQRDWEADLALANRLMAPGEGVMHASPFEHVATPATFGAVSEGDIEGNFHAWHQFRHEIEV